MPPGFHRLIAAQFCSALADNAVLIVSIALLQSQGQPGWLAPMLKFCATLSYVLLAPFVGPLADAVPKARLMACTNALKALALLALMAGTAPLLCFALLGCGAAVCAPAKYGLATELVPAQRLIAANAWIEVSVVAAVLLGTVLGGSLVSQAAQQGAAQGLALLAGWTAPHPLWPALALLLLVYGASAALNIGLPDSGARYAGASRHPGALLRQFVAANRLLWCDRRGGLSLAVTTLFWGVGATLQFAVLRWAVEVLASSLSQAASLQAAVAGGVVLGAGAAGRCITLAQAHRMLPVGVALGLSICTVAFIGSWVAALPMLVLIGAIGGLLVVPMNALLQHRGQLLMTAGRSIAVQNFNENISILVMLASYTGLLWLDVAMVPLMVLLGLATSALVGLMIWRERSRPPLGAAPAPA
jgi:LPLT family lysophospholipid transporter-like MFS transporter